MGKPRLDHMLEHHILVDRVGGLVSCAGASVFGVAQREKHGNPFWCSSFSLGARAHGLQGSRLRLVRQVHVPPLSQATGTDTPQGACGRAVKCVQTPIGHLAVASSSAMCPTALRDVGVEAHFH